MREGFGNKQNVTRSQTRCCLHLAYKSAYFFRNAFILEKLFCIPKKEGFLAQIKNIKAVYLVL